MRANRAYLAGFGTSGSLLAGAAVLFLLGSAIVAFKGWPQIGGGPVTSNVAGAPVAVASRDARRLTAALATTRPHVRARGAVGSRVRGHRVTRRVGTGAGVVPTGGGSTGAATGGSAGASSGVKGVAAPSTCSGCQNPASPSPVSTLTRTVVQTVNTVGNDVSQQITGLTGTAAGQLSQVNSQTGSTVGGAGSTAGSAVTGTATSATNAIPGGH